MLVEILIGCLIGVILFDRFHIIFTVFPALFETIYSLIFSKPELSAPQFKECVDSETIQYEKHFEIPQNIDESLTRLLETVFCNYLDFINNQLDLSKDLNKRIRQIVQHFFSDLSHRISKVDAKSLVFDSIIPKTAFHLRVSKKAFDLSDINETNILRKAYASNQIHCGVLIDENDEETYLKNLFESVLHLSLPINKRNSRILIYLLRSIFTFNIFKPLIDYLSNQNNLKAIISKIFNGRSRVYDPGFKFKRVTVLRNFTLPSAIKWRTVTCPPKELRVNWSQLQSNPSLMYVFLQVFKKNSQFIFPHFCVAYEEWTSKISKSENMSISIKADQIHGLILEAREIFKVFINPESFHRIKFNEELINKIKEIDFEMETEENLIRIRCLYGILHNIAFKVLNSECLDYFYHSPQFFMLCFGERTKIRDRLSSYHITKSRHILGITTTSQGKEKSFSESAANFNNFESDISSDFEVLSDSASREINMSDQSQNIDLSKVTVQIADLKSKFRKNERSYYFIISVNKKEPEEVVSWVVERAYKEFFALENRLKRFHGPRIKHSINPKRSYLMEKNFDYLKHCMKPFEEYLNSLLQNEYLRYSSMLNAFLSDEEVVISPSFFSRTSAVTGRAIQSVIGTLSSQKGKHIDGFINCFAMSTETHRPKSHHKNSYSKIKKKFAFLRDSNSPNTTISQLRYSKPKETPRDLVHEIMTTIIEIINPTNLYNTIAHLLYAIFGGISEMIFRRWVSDKIDQMLHPQSIADLIDNLNDFVISISSTSKKNTTSCPTENALSSQPNQNTDNRDQNNVHNDKNISESDIYLEPFLNLLIYPDLNKQLLYNLLDDIFAAIYPELTQSKPILNQIQNNL